MSDKNNIIPLASRKKPKLSPKPLRQLQEINEVGEITIEKHELKKRKTPWQYRFFMYMVVFLLVSILLSWLK